MLNHLYALSIKVSTGPAGLWAEELQWLPGSCSTCQEQDPGSRGVEMGPGCLVSSGTNGDRR